MSYDREINSARSHAHAVTHTHSCACIHTHTYTHIHAHATQACTHAFSMQAGMRYPLTASIAGAVYLVGKVSLSSKAKLSCVCAINKCVLPLALTLVWN